MATGTFPLHTAASLGQKEKVRVLLSTGEYPVDSKNHVGQTLLHLSCHVGHTDLVRVLLSEFGADINARDKRSNTPLTLAALGGYRHTVHTLITEYGCSPNVRGFFGRTLLHQACEGGHLELVNKLFTDYNLDPNARDDQNHTPLTLAVYGGHFNVCITLITEYGCSADVRGFVGSTLLHLACCRGHLELMNKLVTDYNLDPNARDDVNDTPLTLAALCGHCDVCITLITEYGCSPNVRGFVGRTLLHRACYRGHLELMNKFITDYNLDPNACDGENNTPLTLAADGGHSDVCHTLITEYDCSPNVRGFVGRTLLHKACRGGHLELMNKLITNYNLDPNACDDQNDTPLTLAALGGHTDVCHTLITEYGCSPNVRGFGGRTLLHHACDGGHLELMHKLITDYNLDPNGCDNNGDTPLHLACRKEITGKNKVVRELLVRYMCPVECSNLRGKTPLHFACSKGCVNVVKMLVSEFGADVNAHDKQNMTPPCYAALNGHTAVLDVLELECRPHAKRFHRRSLLHQACKAGHVELMNKLISSLHLDLNNAGGTVLHCAVAYGSIEVIRELISRYMCPVECRNLQGKTPLHFACSNGCVAMVRVLVSEFRADVNAHNWQRETPLILAALGGHSDVVCTLITEYGCSPNEKDYKGRTLLHHVCHRGHLGLMHKLVSDFNLNPNSFDGNGDTPLHFAALTDKKEVVKQLLTRYNCPVECRNSQGKTPLHNACRNGCHDIVIMLVSEFGADVNARDCHNDTPLSNAAFCGHTDVVYTLVTKFGCSTIARGCNSSTLLHQACSKGHLNLVNLVLSEYGGNLFSIDEDGDTPLHVATMFNQPAVVQALLFDHNAPLFVRNRAGKTPTEVAISDEVGSLFRTYMVTDSSRIHTEYEKLQALGETKLSKGSLTRVFVVGHPEVGKSSLVQALQHEGLFSSLFSGRVTEADVPPHTAGIIPTLHSSKDYGRVLFYDFAGDPEYYSSHAAILEMLTSVGTNVFFTVVDLSDDRETSVRKLKYWLSFISYYSKNPHNSSKVVIIGSHLDVLECKKQDPEVAINYLLMDAVDHCTYLKTRHVYLEIGGAYAIDCCSPHTTRMKKVRGSLKQLISSEDNPMVTLSPGASILLGLLERDFSQVVACKMETLLQHIETTGIRLPKHTQQLSELLQELHQLGLLMMIQNTQDRLNSWILLNISALTHKVHKKLFSKGALQITPHLTRQTSDLRCLGILPEPILTDILPENISKECLLQLQYCHEFHKIEVLPDHSVTQSETVDETHLLFFPALLQLDKEDVTWSTPQNLTCCRGWYIECTQDLAFFSTRFLHILLLRLAFAFALPTYKPSTGLEGSTNEAKRSNTDMSLPSNHHSRRCHLWKSGIHWLMKEGVECYVEVVKDSTGVVVVARSEEDCDVECASVFAAVVQKVLETKSEFCHSIALETYLIDPDELNLPSLPDVGTLHLYTMREVEGTLQENKNRVVSIDGSKFLSPEKISYIKSCTVWRLLFPMEMRQVLKYLGPMVKEWYQFGLELGIPDSTLKAIEHDNRDSVDTCKRKMVQKWLYSAQLRPTWCSLVKALRKIEENQVAALITKERYMNLQEKLLDGEMSDRTIGEEFLREFATVVGSQWSSLASLLSFTTADIEGMKREVVSSPEVQALHMLRRWREKGKATYGELYTRLKTITLFQS